MRFANVLVPVLILLAAPSLSSAANSMTQGQPSSFPGWMARHQYNVKNIKRDQPQVVFIGDSITQELEFRSSNTGDINSVWRKYFSCLNSFNLGSVGDTTANALWRLHDGELEGIAPKVVVILIGTNDVGPQHRRSPDEAFEGIKKIVDLVSTSLKNSQIILLELLPRQEKNAEVDRTNELLKAFFSNKMRVHIVSLRKTLLVDGEIDPSLYREGGTSRPLLHPNLQGWSAMAAVLAPQIYDLVGKNCTK